MCYLVSNQLSLHNLYHFLFCSLRIAEDETHERDNQLKTIVIMSQCETILLLY
jgi:hypothetical protein